MHRNFDRERRQNTLLTEDISHFWEKPPGVSNQSFLTELLRAVQHAARVELTARQRLCFSLFYDEGLTVRQIARRLRLCDSTVSRHLTAARERVRSHARYCAIGRAPGGSAGEARFWE